MVILFPLVEYSIRGRVAATRHIDGAITVPRQLVPLSSSETWVDHWQHDHLKQQREGLVEQEQRNHHCSSRLQFISKNKFLVFLYIQLRHRHILLVYYCLQAGAKHRVREADELRSNESSRIAREASSCEATSLRSRQGARSAVGIPHCCASRGSVACLLRG